MDEDVTQGLLLIPDITGYTHFMKAALLAHARKIVAGLLESIINSTAEEWDLSEIEGDALFFYRLGAAPSFQAIHDQIDRWFKAFHDQLDSFRRATGCPCGACLEMGQLTLKVVGHYGEFAVQNVGGKKKLIGKDVILVHCLLKNHLSEREYFLFTDNLLRVTGRMKLMNDGLKVHEETYPDLGTIPLQYIGLSTLMQGIR